MEAIQGVIDQNCPFPLEFVISDDCSTDGTSKLISECIESFNNQIEVKFYSQDFNLGIIQNFTFALNQCRGKYIAVCEGDDYWIDNMKLSKQVDLLEKDNSLVGSFHLVKVKYEGKPYLSNIFKSDVPNILGTEELIAKSSMMHTSSLLFRRSALILPEWYSTMLSGDFALSSILSKYGSFKKVPDIMSVYRVHDYGVTNSKAYNTNNIRLKIDILERLNEYHDYKYMDKFQELIQSLQGGNSSTNFFLRLRRTLRIGIFIKKIKYIFTRRS
jgi:glycosyltransferase involved in cell wall biosynthesis